MIQTREVDPLMGELYLAGEVAPPGEYREITCGRLVELQTADVLPASLNGQVACYHRFNTPRNASGPRQPHTNQAG